MIESTTGEVIYQGSSIITVETLPDYPHPVVIKRPSKPHASRRLILSLEKEYEMTRSLDMVKGVRKAIEQRSIENQPVLVLEYIDGQTLRDCIASETLNLRSRLEIAVELARILTGIHQQNVIHLDLNSKNILIGNKQQSVHVIDLGAASHIDRTGQLKVRPDQLLGTLPYISPEQTGRINRAVDERSDLYSLGVVLYELMTRQLPFDSKDPLKLIHDHIARVPDLPSEVSSEIPEVLSAIILKLLSKDAEDRYQSAAGVQADLETCLRRLKPDNTIGVFPIGEADYSSWLRFPQKLYGRDSELKELEIAFDNACRESSGMVFVGGYSGIGKTALVEEMQRPVSEKPGYFVRGKFDQYLRTTPYAAITQAFAELVSQILVEPDKNFNMWRDEVQAAVGDLGKVLTEVMPALEELIGPQPSVPQLGGQESENRFNYVLINFLLAVATKQHPLVLFIDDLQWIDAASLRLLKVIRSDVSQPGLLVIGAYRDNEVNASHPLMEIISDVEEMGMLIWILKLDNLQQQHLEALLSDTLRSQEGVEELGGTIYEKSQGNPFFSRRLLTSLNQANRIHFDSETKSWKWDIGDIDTEAIEDNVADLLATTVAHLPKEARNILTLAACIGNRFDISTLAMISGLVEQEVIRLLTILSSGQYVYESGDSYEFVHDQVQQAAYGLIGAQDRMSQHLELGRLLLRDIDESELEERIFDIVTHYNLSAELLTDAAEKIQVAELNLRAGRKAKSATAYAEGFAYVVLGLALLDTDSWQHHYDLTLAMHIEAVELSYLTGNHDKLDEIEGLIHKNAQSILDRARVYYIRTMIDTDKGRLLESIETGIGALAELGITIPHEPSNEDIERAEAAFTEVMATRSIADLAHLPEITDKGTLAAMEIMAAVLLNAYIASPSHLSLLTYHGASLSLQRGNGPWSPFFYSVIVLLWGGAVDISPNSESAQALEAAQKLAMVLLRMLENPKYARCKAKSLDAILASLNWHMPLRQLLDLSLEIYQSGLDSGDLVYAGLGAFHLANFGLASGMNLNEYNKTVSAYRKSVIDIGQDYTYRMTGIGLQTAQNLMTPCPEPNVLEEQHFDERQWLPEAVAANDGLTLFLAFQAKLLLSYHFDRDGRLMEYAGEAEKYLESVYGMINIALFRFYDSLSLLRLSSSLSADERKFALKRVESNQLRMRIWAQSGPMSYQHKYNLVEAELARVSGNIGPAIENYERAIEGARENAFVHEEALANELCARFWREFGNDRIAKVYMREAHALYDQWGADAKVSHLEERYPRWFKTKTIFPRKPDIPDGSGKIQRTITPIQLDMESVIRASQLLSAETDVEQLLTRLMALVMTNSGAERAVLLLRQDDDWFIQAQSDIAAERHEVLLNRPFDPADSKSGTDLVPERVFLYCRRSKEVLVVGDARLDHRFAEDRMIQTHDIKSMACIPTLSHGKLKALLYLENRRLADVFSLERLEILKHLSSQFGISVEVALLYDGLNQKIKELEESDERYELAVAGSTTGIWDWDIATDTIYYSDRFVELLSYEPADFSNSLEEFWGRLHPDDLGTAQQAVDRHLAERVPYRTDYRLQTKSGEYRWFHARGNALWDETGRATRMSGSLTDVTERKQVEEELRRSEEQFRSLMERSPLAIEILTPDGQISQVNTAWMRLWGVNEEETAQSLANYNMLSDSQIADLGIAPLVERAFSGQPVVLPPIHYHASRAAEEVGLDQIRARSRWVQCHLYAVKDAIGKIDYVVNIYTDITELRRAEREAQEQREALARVDRASSMGQLTGSISHELNQPLTGILSNAQAAELIIQNGQWEDEEMAEIMAEIVSDAKRAGAVIRNLRQLYREQRVEFLPVDINEIVEETIQLLHSEFIIQRVVLTKEYASSMPWVNGNKVQVQQVLVNLVMNGHEAMRDKARDDRRIHIVTAYDATEVKAWVEDSGSGIDPDRIDRIFEPLATWKPGHTGMGLAISNSIIKAHGGRMWAENRPEGGARVGFALPLPKEEEET